MRERFSHDPGLYARSFVDVYDSWYHDLDDPDDLVEAFRRRCQVGATVVEFGGGTGRLAAPLERADFTVVSTDVSATMLSATPGEAMLVASDMAHVALRSDLADAVLIAYNTIFNLASQDLQQQCLNEARRILRLGGLLAIEAFVSPSDSSAEFGISIKEHPTRSDATVAIISRHDPTNNHLIHGSHIERLPEATTCRPWQLVYQSPDEIDAAAAVAGFDRVDRTASWDRQPFNHECDRHISWYRAR